ncbi:PAS domain S-box-containing protein [Mariniflexile fucanivorans]|uniref:histidine kinase n=1 Tax=Mariniflexile fucanivorans TaxID=264023 RepID=A0A4R1RGJ7_9FLAO|nr:PAS domain-containing protein [Mariniflexile fucanivorans]TCL65101.1 PAS domain S-box-containing protein [Mariniflexile fucanivorans]
MKRNTLYLFFKKPLIAGLATFVALLVVTQYIAYQKYLINENEQKKKTTNEIETIKQRLLALIMYNNSATKHLAYIVERNGIPDDFDKIANELLEINKYFSVVELVDRNGFITHVYPQQDNDIIGFNILKNPKSGDGAFATIKRKDFFMAGPVPLKQGGVGMVSRQPIFIDGEFAGFSAVVSKLSDFLNDLGIDPSNNKDFKYQLSRVNLETGNENFFLETDMSPYKKNVLPFKMFAGEWKLYVIPTEKNIYPVVWFSIFGILISIVGGFGIWYFLGESERLQKLISKKLITQESELKLVHEITSEKIKKSEANLIEAQHIAKLGSWEFDIKNAKLSCSPEAYRIFEKDPEKFEVTLEAFHKMVHPADSELLLKTYNDSVKNNKPYQITYRLVFDNNRIKYVDEQGETFYNNKKEPIKSFGTIQDITERKKTEDILRNSELLYRTLTSNAPVGIFNADAQGACTYVNEEWMKYSGMTFNEAMGTGWKNAVHPDDLQELIAVTKKSFLNNNVFKTDLRFLHKNGNVIYLQSKVTKLFDSNNNLYGYIGILIDITERVNNEKELLIYKNNLEKLVNSRTEELNDSKEALLNLLEDINLQSIELEKEKVKAQSADLMKSAFLANMSHELRTPMNSIIGFTSILLKEFAGPINEEQAKQLGMVKKSGQHLLSLINDVLDISKIEAGELVVSFETFDYLELLNSTITFITPQAFKKGLKINSETSLPKIMLLSDKRRVEQVLLNLLSNAIKFSNKGTIVVKVEVEDNMLTTHVIDEGIGISKPGLNKLFNPFIQLDGGLNRSQEGTGLGLSISKSLVEKLGGTIEVVSELGKGSDFLFKLPLNQNAND